MDEVEVATIVLVGLVMLIGLGGTIIPILPGLLVIWGAGLVYGMMVGFEVTWMPFAVMSALTVVGYALAFALPGMRGAAAGAPIRTLVLGALGAAVGFVVLPVVGLPIGGVAAIYLAERQRIGEHEAAWRSTEAVLVGLGLSVGVQLLFALAMVGTWIVWLFR